MMPTIQRSVSENIGILDGCQLLLEFEEKYAGETQQKKSRLPSENPTLHGSETPSGGHPPQPGG